MVDQKTGKKVNIYLHSHTNSLWIMSRTIDFSPEAIAAQEKLLEEEENDAQHDCTARVNWVLLCGCVYRGIHCCYRGQCCRGKPIGRSAQIQRYLKVMLFYTVLVCIMLFLDLSIMGSEMYNLTGGTHECPSSVTPEDWDCFLFDRTVDQISIDCTYGTIPWEIDTSQWREEAASERWSSRSFI